jgi:hypothetical protein
MVSLVSTSPSGFINEASDSLVVKAGRFVLSFDAGQVAENILLNGDDYLSRMTHLDRAVRMRSKREDISEEEFRIYLVQHILEWEEEEIADVVKCFQEIDQLFQAIVIKFQEPIHLVKTTGKEDVPDAGAYCRKNTIVLCKSLVRSLSLFIGINSKAPILIHELFHIQSQNDPEKRKQLYALIGFRECKEVTPPKKFYAKRITNPDAPQLNARIAVTVKGEKHDVIPMLLCNMKDYANHFFDRLYIKMLAVTNVGTPEHEEWKYVEKEGHPVTFKVSDCSDFISQIGTNTSYDFHPEEILAENFRLMMLGASVPMPRLIDKIYTIFLPSSEKVQIGRFFLSFDTGKIAQYILIKSDDYLKRMTYLDRAVRMRSKRTDISKEEFRIYLIQHVLKWEEAEVSALTYYFERIDALCQDFFIKLPDTIHLIKTTGKEDVPGARGYCRKNTIVLDQDKVREAVKESGTNQSNFYGFLLHELFHIQSQNDPEKRKEFYELLGFKECNEIPLPPEFLGQRLTNPDAPKLNVRINVTVNGQKQDVVPVLLYDAKRGDRFAARQYVTLLAIKNVGTEECEEWKYIEREENGHAVVFNPTDCTDFDSQVGTNTSYRIHPEEILAENFKLMMVGASVPMPQITDRIKQIFLKP